MKKISLVTTTTFFLTTSIALAQWTGQTSSTDLTSPISRTGMVNIDGYNTAQIRLNSSGTYYGKIGNPSPQVWSLGWGGSTTDINPVFSWTAGGNVGIGTTTPSNTQNWDRVLNIDGSTNSKMIASSSSQNFRTGIYSHSTWNGGGGFVGTETNHKLFFMTNYTTQATLDVNGNVGIGTTSPEAKFTISEIGNGWNDGLRINRDASNYLTITEDVTDVRLKNWGYGGILFFTSSLQAVTITNNGNVGIGTAAPAYKLDVNGPINATSLNINGQPVTSTQWTAAGAGASISYTGKVGIGTPLTNNPNNYSLAVNGTIGAKDVRVEKSSATWPDYVFDKSYDLPSLKELENYIQQHKHLADVPSAKTVEEKGYSLNEMDVILLKKVEELSLYIIQQQKEIQHHQNEMDQQRKEIDMLKKKLK